MPALENLPPYVDVNIAANTRAVLDALRRYHRYRVVGMQNIPPKGPALLVVHHSFCTYDILLLGYCIFEATNRLPRALADKRLFDVGVFGRWAHALGAVQGEPNKAAQLLEEGHLVMVAPGGMREALRHHKQRYTTSWEGRLGFARLALQAQVPVIPAACPAADDVFTVYPSKVTDFLFERLHVPVPVFRGLGCTLLPRPRTLTHYVGQPILPPSGATSTEAHARSFAGEVNAAMRELLAPRAGRLPLL